MNKIPKEIIQKAANGDLDAFKQIYEATSSFVFSVTYKVLNNYEDTQEVTQDVFIKVFNKLKSFEGRSSLKTWIYRIAVNTALSRYRKSTNEVTRKTEYTDNVQWTETTNETRKHLDQKHYQQQVAEMLKILNPDQKICVILKDIKGFSYEEIAQTLKIKINTVRSRLKRAREKLYAFSKTQRSDENEL